ncbi:long-chain fatty acid--CoA ligase [Actinomadura syzygii]|uniref:Long-chain fatty acid--CoA ligase n=1 Tax=Actinomadura syzygii TaxID=1427538 RepID=A0A5D0TST2_9ACTN|nr:long-chain fatty acid--CoA ligase [Actinomadura syzygii]
MVVHGGQHGRDGFRADARRDGPAAHAPRAGAVLGHRRRDLPRRPDPLGPVRAAPHLPVHRRAPRGDLPARRTRRLRPGGAVRPDGQRRALRGLRSPTTVLLYEHIENAARRRPADTALVCGGRATTYAELDAAARRICAVLAATTEPGDRIAVLSDNRAEFVQLLFAVPGSGRTLVLLNPRSGPNELADAVRRSGARVLVTEPAFADGLAAWRDRVPLREVVWMDAAPDGSADPDWARWLDADPAGAWPVRDDASDAWLIYTSGTTGRSKGVVLSHRAVSAAAAGFLLALSPRGGMRMLMPFSLSHVTAHAAVAVFAAGGTLVLQRRFRPADYLRAIGEHRVTIAAVAPAMLAMLLAEPELEHANLESLDVLFYGSSPINPDLIRATMRAFPGVSLVQAYGQTESTGAAVWLDAEAHRRGVDGEEWLLGCAGRPGPLVGMRLVDESGRDVPSGVPGEVLLRADQVMSRYWDDPESTRGALSSDGWLRTGDLGVLHESGVLRLIDRKKDLIITGGENVSSVEVENALLAHPDVREAAVVGVPDPVLGEAVCAVVVRRPGSSLDEEAVVAHARAELASYKKPRIVRFVEALPRNAAGKVLKQELRANV